MKQGEMTRWCPIYLEDHVCVGKVQISISVFHSSDKMTSTKVVIFVLFEHTTANFLLHEQVWAS